MIRALRRRWYRRTSPKQHHDYPRRLNRPMTRMVLLVGERQVEWYTRDPLLPLRWERSIRIQPRGTPTTQ